MEREYRIQNFGIVDEERGSAEADAVQSSSTACNPACNQIFINF
jgi:hypothetical protein